MKLYISIIGSLIITACTNQTTQQGTNSASETIHTNLKDTIVINRAPLLQAGCYEMITKKDTARLALDIKDSLVSGSLNYITPNKDSNSGTIKGVIRDSIIYVDYTSNSKGRISTRKLLFKIRNNALVEASGQTISLNNNTQNPNKNTSNSKSIHPFTKVPCTSSFKPL